MISTAQSNSACLLSNYVNETNSTCTHCYEHIVLKLVVVAAAKLTASWFLCDISQSIVGVNANRKKAQKETVFQGSATMGSLFLNLKDSSEVFGPNTPFAAFLGV